MEIQAEIETKIKARLLAAWIYGSICLSVFMLFHLLRWKYLRSNSACLLICQCNHSDQHCRHTFNYWLTNISIYIYREREKEREREGESIGTFTVYLCIRHHVPNFSDAFLPIANKNISTFVTHLFPTTQWHYIRINLHTSFCKGSFQSLLQQKNLNVSSVISAWQFLAPSIFLLRIDGIKIWCSSVV